MDHPKPAQARNRIGNAALCGRNAEIRPGRALLFRRRPQVLSSPSASRVIGRAGGLTLPGGRRLWMEWIKEKLR